MYSTSPFIKVRSGQDSKIGKYYIFLYREPTSQYLHSSMVSSKIDTVTAQENRDVYPHDYFFFLSLYNTYVKNRQWIQR